MNHASPSPFAGRTWLPYASIKLSPKAANGDFLAAWLKDTLRPLALPGSFSEKVHASARDAAASVPAGIGQVHILVFTHNSHPQAGQTWGFFRMVKNNETPVDPSDGKYAIIFYLYAEGSAKPD